MAPPLVLSLTTPLHVGQPPVDLQVLWLVSSLSALHGVHPMDQVVGCYVNPFQTTFLTSINACICNQESFKFVTFS